MSTKITYNEQELVALLQQRTDHSFNYLNDNYAGALLGVVGAMSRIRKSPGMYYYRRYL